MSTLTVEQEQKLNFLLEKRPCLSELIENNPVEDVISILEFISLNKILEKQVIPDDNEKDMIGYIVNQFGKEIYWACIKAFTYGKIQGIRAERAKKVL